MPAPGDLVHQTSITAGSGAQTLVAVNGKRTFNAVFGTGGSNVFDYFISHRTAAEWERGTGHEASGTLVRDTVLASSNANALVTFSAGIKDVTNDVPATKQVVTDLTQTLSNKTLTGIFGVIDDAINNAGTIIAKLTHTTTGTPAIGISSILAFEAETSAGNNEIGSTIESVATAVGAGAEAFDLVFKTMLAGAAAAERMRIRSTGNIWLGGITAEPQGLAQINSAVTGNTTWGGSWVAYGAVASPPAFAFSKTRNASPTSHTAVAINDMLMMQSFYGSDGSAWVEGARIACFVENTVAAGRVPTCLSFYTMSDGAAFIERMRLDRNGQLILNQATWTMPAMTIGQFCITPTSNVNAQIGYKGTDGTVRFANITLA